MADVTFHPQARAEYERALADYQAVGGRVAARFETEMDRVLGLISAFPEAQPELDAEHRFCTLRRFQYIVVYRLEVGDAFVVALAHTSREPGYWHGR